MVARIGAFVASTAAVLSTLLLFIAWVTIPYLPAVRGHNKPSALPGMPTRDLKPARFLSASYRHQLALEIKREQSKLRDEPFKGGKVVAAFYAPWEAASLASLRAHASSLTHVLPQWLHLTANGDDVDYATDFNLSVNTPNRDVIQIARANRLSIVPILDNSFNGQFEPHRMRLFLASEKAQQAVALELASWLTAFNFQGINLDFEMASKEDGPRFVRFLRILRREFDRYGLTISTDIEVDSNLPLEPIGELCDWVVLMAYDHHSEEGTAGDIAGIDWAESALEKALEDIPNEKLVLGMGSYAYDWVEGKPGAENRTFQQALTDAAGYRSEPPWKVIQLDPTTLNNHFEYRDDSDVRHQVWMLDAVSVYNQWKAARSEDLKGAALWYLGAEDPSIWNFLGRARLDARMDASSIAHVRFPYEISFDGRGEILSVKNEPHPGSRIVKEDPASGAITTCIYQSYASPYVIQKTGFIPKKLALTFDDGPDPEWTPQVLKVLAEYNVPATFFVIGNSCEEYPGLVAAEYEAGHEVGSHSFMHPNMGAISTQRDRLELNLTQLAIECATGRSTILFRPPFNADSEPETAEQVKPVEVASQMGYVTVAENVDPEDWYLKVPLKEGGYRPKDGEDIASFVVADLKRRVHENDEGNVILLHDAGGDRSATVAALRILIPRLRSEGYQLVTVSQLMGTTRDKVMPPIPEKDLLEYFLARIVLRSTYGILWFLSVSFVVAIGLGLARIFLMTCLALAQRRRERPLGASDYQPPVSVLVAAFNEEKVIQRTIESVLGSDYPIAEVIVIDDGSKDATAATVLAAFTNDPRVRLIRKENGGKASALNVGTEEAIGEVLFCIDADTQLHSMAVRLMVRHFADSKVGAVAGNVRVGNPVNIITFWQSLEYTTSQNLDRRAYALLNAITVVPGAVGAWRKDAIVNAGGYLNDTLAEDMDLTWRLRTSGWRIANESDAYAYTEAPESFGGFFRQRFRWAYGTLQCLYKHRQAMFHYDWFGWLALPSLWVFQVLFQALAPLVDLQVIISVVKYSLALAGSSGENGSLALEGETQTILRVGFLYAVFFVVELMSAAIATRMDRQRYGLLWWLFLQRFAYRQIMYGVIYRSLVRAITGGRTGWGKIDRKGTVKVPQAVP
jgi:poly-beta-1,6 N-acetyl-D-glucosamine synthase